MSAPLLSLIHGRLWSKQQIYCLVTSVQQCRRCSADIVVNHKVYLDPQVEKDFNDKKFDNPKKHPGIMNSKALNLPTELLDAVNNLVQTYPIQDAKAKSQEMCRYLWSRKLPVEHKVVDELSKQLKEKFQDEEGDNFSALDPESNKKIHEKIERKVKKILNSRVYHWKPLKYDAQRSFLYMIGRIAPDYRILHRIFSEIALRDENFQPERLFDFGSGIGSVTWAANNVWEKRIKEHYCVDSSSDMNTLARLLLQGGEEAEDMMLPGVYFRQYFPSSMNKYDLAVSAFSLLELSSQSERLQRILALWEKTEKYLVIVENGTFAGFTAISEARDFIIQIGEENEDLKGHVFAPCPHDLMCPRGLRNDRSPCNFETRHYLLPIQREENDTDTARFCYVILRKGERDDSVVSWPRLVRPSSPASRHMNCRTCAANGELQMTTITAKKHGKLLYSCAKASKWGDLLPVISKVDTEETEFEGVDFTDAHHSADTDTTLSAQTCDHTLATDSSQLENVDDIQSNLEIDSDEQSKWDENQIK